MTGVSFVVPVRNGEPWIDQVIGAMLGQDAALPFEIIVVDDGSGDRSREMLDRFTTDPRVKVVEGPRRGAAAAINTGIRASRYALIAQVDQDVVIADDWLRRLVAELEDPAVGAAQGYYLRSREAGLFARVMNLDLQQRYAAIRGAHTGHVCTGNTLYRAAAVCRAGLFDESLGYGYDNDMSYRLRSAGYRLVIDRAARSVHHWREGPVAYARQQYGFGYGRLDLVAKHPTRCRGDSVSPPAMMAHPLVTVLALAAIAIGAIAGSVWTLIGGTLLAGLFIERTVAGIAASRRFGDLAALAFPVVHLLRDLVWSAAIVMWSVRRMAGRPLAPSHSMRPRAWRAGAVPRRAWYVEAVRRRFQDSRDVSAPAPKRPSA